MEFRRPGATQAETAELRAAKKRIRLLERENEVLPRAAVFGTGRQPTMMYPLVGDLAVEGIPVTVTCSVLGFSTQA